jgi:hypothetical protein
LDTAAANNAVAAEPTTPLIAWGNFRNKLQKYRFILNTPIFMSRHAPNTLYVAANKLLASDDRGHTWGEVSPGPNAARVDSARHARLLGAAGRDGDRKAVATPQQGSMDP